MKPKSPDHSGNPADDMTIPSLDLARLYHLLLAKAWLIVLFVVLGLLGAMAYLLKTPSVYASRAVIQVEQEGAKVVNIQDITSEDFRSLEVLKTIEQSLTSQTLLLRVIKANNLHENPAFAPSKKDGTPYSDSELVELFEPKLSVKLRRGTRLIGVTVEDTDPELARQLAESMVKEFIGQNFDQKLSVSRMANSFLLQEGEALKAKLQSSEQALQEYRARHQAVSLEEKQNIIVEKLRELNLKVTEAKSERLRLEADVASIQAARGRSPEDLLVLASISALPEIADLRKQINDKEAEFAALKERYFEKYPKYIEIERQLQELRAVFNRALTDAAGVVLKSYESARATEQKLMGALKEQEQLALDLDKVAIPYNVLAREVESDRALYESVLKRMKETHITQDLEKNNIRLVETPLVAASPVRPHKALVLALALFGGFILGVGMVLVIDLSDSSLSSVDQAEETLGIPVLASVPAAKRKDLDLRPAVSSDPVSHEAEAFRTLRTSLSLMRKEDDRKSVLFTSANPSEGKSFCAINHAAALAQQGLRTLLIDADLRRPRLTQILTSNPAAPGLTACLTGDSKVHEVLQPTDTENLFVLSAGARAPRPAELLASSDFASLIEEASLFFDRIVVDSAPVNAVSDSLLIARTVQSVCLVVWAGRTPRRAIGRACQLLDQAGHAPDGIVLNRMARGRRAGYYAYYYSGDYAKAGAYGSDR